MNDKREEAEHFEDSEESESPARPSSQEEQPFRIARIKAAMLHQGSQGANWFYWIAGLSVVNSLLLHFGANIQFVVGLGITLLVDAFASAFGQQHPEIATTLKLVGIGVNVFLTLSFVGFGYFANRGNLWIFGIGMVLYILDGAIFLLFQNWLSIGFHAYAAYFMWKGFSAFRQLRRLESAVNAE